MQRGLRSDVRRAAAQADDSAAGAGPAGAAGARRRRSAKATRSSVDAGQPTRADVREARDGERIDRSWPHNRTPLQSARRRSPRSVPSAAGPSSLWYGLGVSCSCSAWRRCTSWRPAAGPFRTASSRRWCRTARSPRSTVGEQIDPRHAEGAARRRRQPEPTQFTTTRVDDPKLTEELERQRREVHRRARQPLAAGAARLDRCRSLFFVAHLGLLLPPDGRRRRRRDVVRAQQAPRSTPTTR